MTELLKICEQMCDLKRTLERLQRPDGVRGLDIALYDVGRALGEEIKRQSVRTK